MKKLIWKSVMVTVVMQIISNGDASIYMKTAKNNDIECSIIDVREGFVHLCL
jgi:hypothetical protein